MAGKDRGRGSPWYLATLVAGVLIGTTLLSPAGAHVTGSVTHLWKKHIRPKADARYDLKKDTPWAVINVDGTIASSRRVASAQRLGMGNGTYEVVFGRNVQACAYMATLRESTLSGEILAEPKSGSPNAVFVLTRNSTGGEADKAFSLTVICD